MEIFDNFVLWTTLLSWGIAQVFKVIITLIVDRKFSLERLLGDGGMPSSHSATVSCLAILIGWYVGFDSVMFALAAVFAVVVMHDASGVRRETGKQALSIKELANAVNELFVNKDEHIKTEKLKVLVGHTPLQVFFGALLGITVSIVHILIFG